MSYFFVICYVSIFKVGVKKEEEEEKEAKEV